MSDLISREAVIEGINQHCGTIPTWTKVVVISEISEQPTVEAKEVVHAEWRHLGGDEWCCTECGYVISTEGSWEKPKANFCEECGADMRTSAE